ncbi:hypothetical protein GW17_00051191 [Ensete ventricosum]|nr:hypothetical protein GW17_00051191 [Ensete ventricosum]
MTPGVGYGDTEERRLERHVGCIAGFLQLFDRHNVLAWRRHATCSTTGSTSPSERSEASSASSLKESHPQPSSPESRDEAESPPRRSLPLPLPVFEAKEGARITWRVRDAPRLSLDSRAVVDGKGKLHPREIWTAVSVPPADQSDATEQLRSPSVVARLIGVDALPSAGGVSVAERVPAELRRSVSESRVRRDPSYYVDAGSFHMPPPPKSVPFSIKELSETVNVGQFSDAKKLEPTPRTNSLPPLHRKSFFDSEDLFPEPKQLGHYGDIENRLRMRGIDEPAKDLETLKQILDALQLKGLLRSKPSDHGATGRRNRIYDNQGPIPGGAPIVIMKPTSKPPRRPSSEPQRFRSGVARRSAPPVRRERVASVDHSIRRGNERSNRAPRSPESPISPVHRRASNAAARSPLSLRGMPMPNVGSPKSNPKRAGPDPLPVRSPRTRRPTANASPMERVLHPLAEDDASTTVSESSIGAFSRLDFEVVNPAN